MQLGDTALANMTAVPASVFDNADVRLRVWFDEGASGPQLLTPDQRLTSVGFAMKAASAESAQTVPDGAITAAKLGSGAVSAASIAAGAVGSAQLASGLTLGGTTSGTFSGAGGGLTGLNASNISSGTLADARLSASVSLLGASISSAEITDDTIVNADVNAVAAIDATKLRTGVVSNTEFNLKTGMN